MAELKPYTCTTKRMPSVITIETETCRTEIFYPEHGSMEDILTYVNLFNALKLTVADDDITT